MIKVADMDDIGLKPFKQISKAGIKFGGLVAVFKAWIVDQVNGDTPVRGILFGAKAEIRGEWVFLSGKNMDLMVFRQGLAEGLAVNFRTRVVTHWVAVDHL